MASRITEGSLDRVPAGDYTQCQAIVPCLDEAPRIAAVVRELRPRVAHVLVIDDGSRDETAEVARGAGAEVLRHAVPLGKGRCLREGWRVLADRGVPWAICLDGDGQHSPADVPGLIEASARTEADLVVGNRFFQPTGMPWVRRATNLAMSRILSALAGSAFPDSQCGFRLLRPGRVAELQLETERFEIESEVLLAAVRAGWRIEFAPVRTIYRGERSKIRPLTDSGRWLRWLLSRGRPRARSGTRTGR